VNAARPHRLLTLVRHATLILELGGLRFLVDPMLDDVGARPPVANTANDHRNPLVPLPLPASEIVAGLDAVLVTHLHSDHLDDGALRLLPRDVPVFCQPADHRQLSSHGLQAEPVDGTLALGGVTITRTGGRHGTGKTAVALGPVSGFVVDDVYIAGDTVWCDDVADAIGRHRPHAAVVNGSGAHFVDGDPIVMTIDDIREVVARVPQVIVVHLEAINHCYDSRAAVRAGVPEAVVPEDGETISLAEQPGSISA
jgi:L-ascorbate metabolism protein UlaG (beta-lactamase superfamily)